MFQEKDFAAVVDRLDKLNKVAAQDEDTLADVVRHYSELNLDRLHADGESLLRPLRLTPEESADLAAFLESLTEHRPGPGPRRVIAVCAR